MAEQNEWKEHTSYLRSRLEWLLKRHFGERCPSFYPGCIGCERWRALDVLMSDPYSDVEPNNAD